MSQMIPIKVAEMACERLEARIAELEAQVKALKADVSHKQIHIDCYLACGNRLEEALREMPGDYPRCLANEWQAARNE